MTKNFSNDQIEHIKNLIKNNGSCFNSMIKCTNCLLFIKSDLSCYTNDKKIGRLKFIDRFKRAINILKLYYLEKYL